MCEMDVGLPIYECIYTPERCVYIGLGIETSVREIRMCHELACLQSTTTHVWERMRAREGRRRRAVRVDEGRDASHPDEKTESQ